jgi:hypothetical protein
MNQETDSAFKTAQNRARSHPKHRQYRAATQGNLSTDGPIVAANAAANRVPPCAQESNKSE